jgi:hypothetical protein
MGKTGRPQRPLLGQVSGLGEGLDPVRGCVRESVYPKKTSASA